MAIDDYKSLKQLYSQVEDEENLLEILSALKQEINQKQENVGDFAKGVKSAINRKPFNKIDSADKFITFLDLNDTTLNDEIIESINSYIETISKLPDEFKQLFYLIVLESERSMHYLDALEINLRELQSHIGTSPGELLGNIDVLVSDKYDLVSLDDDDPLVYVFLCLPNDDNFAYLLKLYCEEYNFNLKQILVEGDFSLLN